MADKSANKPKKGRVDQKQAQSRKNRRRPSDGSEAAEEETSCSIGVKIAVGVVIAAAARYRLCVLLPECFRCDRQILQSAAWYDDAATIG
ncbi:MAG: hypothetical protein ACLSDM_05835 [Butyricicoccus sp.]